MRTMITLHEYAIMIEGNIQQAFDVAKCSNALVVEKSRILVDLEAVNLYLENETIDCLKNVNKICGH